MGLPVLRAIPSSIHADVNTPVESLNEVALHVQERRPSPCFSRVGSHICPFRGLLDVHSRFGLHVRQVNYLTFYTRGFDGFVTSTIAPIATGWSDQLPGGIRTH